MVAVLEKRPAGVHAGKEKGTWFPRGASSVACSLRSLARTRLLLRDLDASARWVAGGGSRDGRVVRCARSPAPSSYEASPVGGAARALRPRAHSSAHTLPTHLELVPWRGGGEES